MNRQMCLAVCNCHHFGFAAAIGTQRGALDQLRVGGPLYTKIKLGNDLVADILPPPEYVIEPYLEWTLAMRDPSSFPVRRALLAQLHKDYDERRDYWRRSELDTRLKQELVERSDVEVQRFWKASERDLADALAESNTKEAEKAYAALSTAYTAHSAIIDDIVKQANDANAAPEKQVTRHVDWLNMMLWSIPTLVCAAAVLGLLWIIFGIARPLSSMTKAMRRLADGDLTTGIPSLSRCFAPAMACYGQELVLMPSRAIHRHNVCNLRINNVPDLFPNTQGPSLLEHLGATPGPSFLDKHSCKTE